MAKLLTENGQAYRRRHRLSGGVVRRRTSVDGAVVFRPNNQRHPTRGHRVTARRVGVADGGQRLPIVRRAAAVVAVPAERSGGHCRRARQYDDVIHRQLLTGVVTADCRSSRRC